MEEEIQAADQHIHAVLVVDVGDSIRKKLHALPGEPLEKEPFTIFRVPASVREGNKSLYEPQMVSIGPYHRGRSHLQAMEQYKWRFLRDLLHRWSQDPDSTLEKFVGEMRALEAKARRCYEERVYLDGGEFVEMLLLDGCFILRLLIKSSIKEEETMPRADWSVPLIMDDLLMMENQIPFFVLQALYDLLFAGSDPSRSDATTGEDFIDIISRFLASRNPLKMERSPTLSSTEVWHLLHLYHHCFLSAPEDGKSSDCGGGGSCPPLPFSFACLLHSFVRLMVRHEQSNTTPSVPRTIPSATELQEAGVRFQKKKSPKGFLDVTFRNGTMEIPCLCITDDTKSFFMNLVAFEQCNHQEGRHLMSYTAFMNCIINTAEDVAILETRGIIENMLASKEEAAQFFNQLGYCHYLNYDRHYLAPLFKEVRQYCESDWHKYRAKLVRDYFSNPWAILSLVAALILLFLTLLQTFFGMFSYFHPRL